MQRTITVIAAITLPVLLACAAGPTGRRTPDGGAGQRSDTVVSTPRGGSGPNLNRLRIRWAKMTAGFSEPTQVTSAKDGVNRLFVVQKSGVVKIVRHSHVQSRAYLNVSERVHTDQEGGLLSIVFSPHFKTDHLLWIAYARRSDGDLVIGRMRAPSAKAHHVRSRSLKTVLVVEHSSASNHYGGQLVFGPDGDLYIGTGDGGGGGDPFNTAGRKSQLRGKILRINPMRSCGKKRYCDPSSNPYVGKHGRNEIWLLGLRNPWRFSFDPRTKALWIGDVGQDRFEEIDRVRSSPKHRNLGWSCREGRSIYNASRCRSGVHYLSPVTTVRHPIAEAITGGFVYRGSKYRRILGGAYVFGDYVTGRVWAYAAGKGKQVQRQRLGSGTYEGPTSFGLDDHNEMYAVTYDGTLWRMRVSRG